MANPKYAASTKPVPVAELVDTLSDGTKVKRRVPRMRACNEKDAKGKLCAGHLKRWYFFGEEVKRTAGLKLVPTVISGTQWLNFGPLQWDAKSPWHDRRVRLAAALAFDKDAINQAETLGHSKPTGGIIPGAFEYALFIPPYPYDPARAKKLLAEAGYPNGFDAGEYACDASYSSVAESIGNYLAAVGIRTKLRPMERAAFLGNWKDKKITGILQAGAGGLGNAATRVQNYFVKDGLYSWAATRTSTTCSSSRRASSIPSGARPCSTRSSALPTSASCTRPCGSWAS